MAFLCISPKLRKLIFIPFHLFYQRSRGFRGPGSGLRDRVLDLIGSDLELETHEKEFFIIGCHASRVKAILYESGLLRGRENLEESLISFFLLLVSCFLPLPILTALSTLRIFETGGPPLSFT